MQRQAVRALADVDRQVGDPLQVAVDLQHRRHAPQVDGHRLMQGEDLEALFLDLDLAVVDRLLAGDHLLGDFDAQLAQRLHGAEHHLLDHRRLVEQVLLESFKIALQVDRHERSIEDEGRSLVDSRL